MSKKNEIQNNPEQQARIRANELLVEAGNACTKEWIARLRVAADEAKHAAWAIGQVDKEVIFNAGCTDTHNRAQRNASALALLLSSAADAAEYLNREICGILKDIDAEEIRKIKQSIAIARECKRAEAKHREYERAKIKRAKQLGATINEAVQDIKPDIDPDEARAKLLKKRGRKPKNA